MITRERLADIGYPAIAAVLVVSIWQAVAVAKLVPHYLLPAPSVIAVRMIAVSGELTKHALATSLEIVLGFVVATVLGVGLAVAIVSVRTLERALYPWLVVIQVVPKVALGPLLLVWLGVGLMPKVLIAFLIAFFPIMIDAMVGLRSVQPESIFLLRSMGASKVDIFTRLQLPNALPYIFAGMKVGVTFATIGAIVGEFIGANTGLGYVLIFANGILDTSLLFVALIWVSVLALIFYGLVSALERVFIRWHVSQRMRSVLSA